MNSLLKEDVKSRLNLILMAALVALLVGLALLKSSYFNQIAITTMIFVILAASMNLITGSAGLLSLGHAGFFGVGAYAAALLSTAWGWPIGLKTKPPCSPRSIGPACELFGP